MSGNTDYPKKQLAYWLQPTGTRLLDEIVAPEKRQTSYPSTVVPNQPENNLQAQKEDL